MELVDYKVKLKAAGQAVYLHCFSDIHRSAVGCDVKKLHQDIRAIEKAAERGEKHLWFGGGDFSNSIGARDKRFDHTQVRREFADYSGDDLFQQEARVLAQEFMPIKSLCLGIGAGNHERAVSKYNDFNAATAIAERLNVPYLGYSALMRLMLTTSKQATPCLIYWHHGTGAARSKGSKVRAMESFKDIITNADIYFSGHTHEWMNFPDIRMEGTRKGSLRLLQRGVMFVNSGTYLKAYPANKQPQRAGQFNADRIVHVDYAEVSAYRPSVIGHNGVVLKVLHSGKTKVMPSDRLKMEQFATW